MPDFYKHDRVRSDTLEVDNLAFETCNRMREDRGRLMSDRPCMTCKPLVHRTGCHAREIARDVLTFRGQHIDAHVPVAMQNIVYVTGLVDTNEHRRRRIRYGADCACGNPATSARAIRGDDVDGRGHARHGIAETPFGVVDSHDCPVAFMCHGPHQGYGVTGAMPANSAPDASYVPSPRNACCVTTIESRTNRCSRLSR